MDILVHCVGVLMHHEVEFTWVYRLDVLNLIRTKHSKVGDMSVRSDSVHSVL